MADDDNALTTLGADEDNQLVVQELSGAALAAKSEVEAQLDAAHRYPRSVTRFLREAQSLTCLDVKVAESCMYSFKRGGKAIIGPSIRMAEICASAWGNLHLAARVVAIEDTNVVAQGGAWDLEKNVRYSVENRRKITSNSGDRYNEDMITMTGNAAASIALRNAIFRAIPRAYIDKLFELVRTTAVGKAETLVDRRAKVMERLAKMGADQPRVLASLGLKGLDDIGLDEIAVLIGYGTAIKEGQKTVDDLFPEVVLQPKTTAETSGKRMALGERGAKLEGSAAAKAEEKPPQREPGTEG